MRRLHRWLGLWLGGWLAWMGVTGALMALVRELDGYQPSGPDRLSLTQTLAGLQAQYPDEPLRRLELGEVDRYDLGKTWRLVVDPQTGRVLAKLDREHTPKAWLLWGHELGEKIPALLAVGCSLLLLSGWRLQPPSRRRLREGPGRGAFRWHRWCGWCATPGLGLALVTGFVLVLYGPLEGLLGKPSVPPVKVDSTAGSPLPEQLLARARLAFPTAQPTRLQWPGKPTDPFVVRLHQPGEWNPKGRTFVYLHPLTGEVLQVEDPFRYPAPVRWLQGAFPIHAGLYPGGFVLIALGLTPGLLFATGLWMRQRRNRRPAIKSPRK